ncbi:MAG: ABC transporter ATP-binding protein [Oscillospiraceae bacterium]|nr:ABC transporter ATP-binding protein [Oscillospiraceae bacterium]
MKINPVVTDHFYTTHTSFIVDFKFNNNITILTGDSGEGKSAVFGFIQECMAIDPQLECFNYLDKQKNIFDEISNLVNKLIVIDNADIILDEKTRKFISLDDKNQYLIIGRDPSNLFATTDNLFELVTEKKEDIVVFKLEPYL